MVFYYRSYSFNKWDVYVIYKYLNELIYIIKICQYCIILDVQKVLFYLYMFCVNAFAIYVINFHSNYSL